MCRVSEHADNYSELGLEIPATEALLVGSFYKDPDLYVEHSNYIRSKFDFNDIATKFYYENFELMYKTFSQNFEETNVNAFMSQDKDRFNIYKRYGGYSTIREWVKLAQTEDFTNYYDLVKKFSLLRELHKHGYPIEKVRKYEKFDSLTATDVYRIIRSKVDSIQTEVLADEDSVDISEGMKNSIISHIEAPDMGLEIPFAIQNDMFKGIRKKIMMVYGMLSNDGKTRFMTKLATYIAFFHNKKVLIMANETTESEITNCIITTVINNKEFQMLHNIDINNKPEREITLGQYRGEDGNFVERRTNDKGDFIESLDNFVKRLEEESEEFNKVMAVGDWVEKEMAKKLYVKEMLSYEDELLCFEIRKHKITKGVEYFFYDTMKSDTSSMGDWSHFKRTATVLSELCKEINVFMYASIQLTDDAVFLDIFDLTSNNIANGKQIKHLLDILSFAKRIPPEDYRKYSYIPSEAWGTANILELNPKKTYYGFKTDKNRAGEKHTTLMEVNLNYNTWYEKGLLIKSNNK